MQRVDNTHRWLRTKKMEVVDERVPKKERDISAELKG